MAEKMLNSFDIQDSIADDDIVLGYDKSENKVKNFKFGTGIWNWIVDKMANAVVSKLTTTDKTVLGAINELNSKVTNRMKYIEIPEGAVLSAINDKVEAAKYIIDNLLPNDTDARNFYVVSFVKQTNNIMIAQKLDYNNGYASFILFGYGIGKLSYYTKNDGTWYE